MLRSYSTGTTGRKSILELPMESPNQAVGLWMVGGGAIHLVDIQKGSELTPKRRGELGATVGGHGVRDPEISNPAIEKRPGARGSRGIGDRNSRRPACKTVDDGEEVHETIGWRQRADEVDVDIHKMAVRSWWWRQRSPGVTSDYSRLAGMTFAAPQGNVGVRARRSGS